MKKSFKDKRFFKFGEEGGMVGAACLFISAKEENIPVELVHFAMHMNVTVFALGAVYKKVKESLRLPATRVAVSPTILDVVGKILARLKTDQLSKQIENELTKIKEGYVDIICDDKHVEINKRIESLEQLVELSVLIKDLLPKEELQRVIRLSSEIIYIMKNGCLTSYGNKLAIVGASVFISIMHVDRMKKTSTQKYFSNKMESLLVEIVSDICHSSVSTIKKYKNEFLAKLMELANNQRAIFGNISTKSDVMSIIERLLKISIAFADKEQLHPEAGVEAGLEKFQDSSCDVSKIENSNEYFVNYKRTHVCCACNEEATAKSCSTRKRKTSETCSDCIPNHSTTDSDDSGDLEHAYCGPLISNIKPKTFIKYQELRKKRTELINSRIMNAISNSELQKKLQKILIKTSKEILEQSLTEKEIINYLLILNTPIDHVLSFPTYTLRDILNCKLREPEVKAMNLNDVEVTERDISDNEVSLYLK
ncbi:hypothetical protein AX774_g4994 [Zancudomyces culisetae]|uniref:Uncharacterized protein n=1 Tax=Zancudomyces culisetae TaxID=1213189 RepID=A0A1R1PKQ8_ZANCU|nr:hypothetical protein AX774_g4994 [Zancudomyces culisetae]|eukprot:OMH81544.1 hypothetical protein AX774_g4994 [Zancudomyces culisetae]